MAGRAGSEAGVLHSDLLYLGNLFSQVVEDGRQSCSQTCPFASKAVGMGLALGPASGCTGFSLSDINQLDSGTGEDFTGLVMRLATLILDCG